MDSAGTAAVEERIDFDTNCDALSLMLAGTTREDLVRVRMHIEDLEIFVGQRSRMNPGPGWATLLVILSNDRMAVENEMRGRGIPFDVNPPLNSGEHH